MAIKKTPWADAKTVTGPIKPLGRTIGVLPPSPNRDELQTTEQNTLERIIADPTIDKKDKSRVAEQLIAITRRGEDRPPVGGGGGIKGAIKGVGGVVLGGLGTTLRATANLPVIKQTVTPAAKNVMTGLGYYNRFVQAAAADAAQVVMRPYTQLGTKIDVLTEGTFLESKNAERRKRDAKWYDENRPTFERFVNRINDKEFGLFGTDPNKNVADLGNNTLNTLAQVSTEIYIDPLTRFGVGAHANMGYSGRTALAMEFSTTEMISKYPVLAEAGVIDRIGRLGAAGIPKAIAKAEGINMGLRYAGVVIPRTGALERGFAQTFGQARAGIGDVIFNSKTGKLASGVALVGEKVLTPKSQAGLREVGFGRGRGLTSEILIPELQKFTSIRYAKGAVSTSLARYNQDLLELIKRQRAMTGQGVRNKLKYGIREDAAQNLYKYVEMSEADLLTQPISEELKQLARDTKTWQNLVREDVNAKILKFGADYGVNVREIGLIDDYIHHKLGQSAREWITSEKGRIAQEGGMFRTADVSVKDLTDPNGPVMFRKIRAPYVDPDTGNIVTSKFLGVEITDASMATIDGLNEISRKVLGFDWFETDFVSIMDSYAYSMAKAKGREAFARRAMDFGSDIIKPMLKEVIPDEALVTRLTEVHAGLLTMQNKLRSRIGVNQQLTKDYVTTAVNNARNFLRGQTQARKLNQKEIDILFRRLDEAIFKLGESHQYALTLEASQRGEFSVMHAALLEEVTVLRAAIDNPDRYAATLQLREIYTQMYPNANPAILDKKSPEWLAEKILNGRGIPAARETRVINARLKELRTQIDAIPSGDEYAAARAELESQYYDLEQVESGFSVLANVRAEADYASEGLIYGSANDLIPLPREAMPFKIFRTKPVEEGFDTFPSSVAVHAPVTQASATGPSSVIDLRDGKAFKEFFREDGIVAGIADSLEQRGLLEAGDALRSEAQNFANSGSLDPMFEDLYPELAEIIRTVNNHAATSGDDVSDEIILGALGDTDDLLRIFATSIDETVEDADIFAREVMDDAMAHYIRNNAPLGDAGLLVPQSWIDDGVEGLEGHWAVLMDPEYTMPANIRNPSRNPQARVQYVADNQFVGDIRAGRYEQKSLEASTAKAMKEEEIIALENAQVVSAEARAEVKKLAGQKGGLTRAQNARAAKAEAARAQLQATNSVDIVRNGEKVTLTRDAAQRALVRSDRRLEAAYMRLEQQIDAAYVKAGVPRSGTKGGALPQAITTYKERLPMLLEQAKVLKTYSETTGIILQRDIQDMRMLLQARPPKGAAAGDASAWVKRVDATLNSMGGIQDPALRNAYERVTRILHADEAQLARLEGVALPAVETALANVRSGWLGNMVDVTEKGWEEIAGLGVQMPEELLAIWKPNLNKLRSPLWQNEFYKGYKYTMKFFKTYATASVGFFTRNGLSATFVNIVDGVDVSNIRDGFAAAVAARNSDTWEKFLSKLPAGKREIYENAWKVAETSGRGISDDLSSVAYGTSLGERAVNNSYTRFFQRKNDFIERAVRMPMALDSLSKGKTFDQAVSRVTRNHFDYSDLSGFDEAAKQWIPFWIWTSRNVPLQMVQQWSNPMAYENYNKLAGASPVGSDIVMPKWISDWNPIGLGGPNGEGGQWVLTPDLPNVRLEQQLKQIGTFKGLVGQATPLVKVPIELIAGKQLGVDVGPFGELDQNSEAAAGIDKYVLAPLAKIMGGGDWVATNANGETTLDPRVAYVFQNAFPTFAQLNRVTGGQTGGKRSYQERQLGNILNWMGIPVRYVGPKQQESEAMNRIFEVASFLKDKVDRGEMMSKSDLNKLEKLLQPPKPPKKDKETKP